jgi:hypothetical protein
MPNYAIRVELRGNPTREQYDALHALMKQKGFYQYVDGTSNGKPKRADLPHATYYGSSTSNCSVVHDTVSKAVQSQIQQNIIVFVVEASTWVLS